MKISFSVILYRKKKHFSMSESDIRCFFCIFAIGLIIGFQVQCFKFRD